MVEGQPTYLRQGGDPEIVNPTTYKRSRYDGSEETVSGIAKKPADPNFSQLVLENNGNLIAYDKNQQITFSLQPAPLRDRLLEGETLQPGQSLFSANNKFKLTMQTDGNLVLYAKLSAIVERVLFSLDGGLLPSFTGGMKPGSSFGIKAGLPTYLRQGGNNEVLSFASQDSYYRMKYAGIAETAKGRSSNPAAASDFAKLVLQDDGNLVSYHKNDEVLFSLQVPESSITDNAVDSRTFEDYKLSDTALDVTTEATTNASTSTVAPRAVYSLLYSDSTNSNAKLASTQVLERLDATALAGMATPSGGQSSPLRYIGTTWLDGKQGMLFANPQATTSDHLVVALPNTNYRQAYSNTAALLDNWATTITTTSPQTFSEALTAIKKAFASVPAAGTDEQRFQLALANTLLATEALEQIPGGAGLGVDFQQYIATQAPLYIMSAKTLVDQGTGQPFNQKPGISSLEYSLADTDGDGLQDLIVIDPESLQNIYALSTSDLASLASSTTKTIPLKGQPTRSDTRLARPWFIDDITGDGKSEILTIEGKQHNTITQTFHLSLTGDYSLNADKTIGANSNSLELATRNNYFYLLSIVPREIGDFNADGNNDFAYIHPDRPAQLKIVYSSSELSKLDQIQPGASTVISFDSNDPVVFFGGGGDSNGDGIDDLVLTLQSGKSYTIFGGDFSQPLTLTQAGTDGNSSPYMQSITQTGTIGDDSLHGTAAGDTILGREGSDLILGRGGPDALNGGPGNDIIFVSDDQFRQVDGGIGDDRLLLNGRRDQEWDLTKLASAARLTNLETIDLSDYGGNTLTLNPAALLALTDSRRELLIEGDPLKRSPLQQLSQLIGRTHPAASQAFEAYLASKGISDESLRRLHDGQSLAQLVAPYQTLLTEFWLDSSTKALLPAVFTMANRDALLATIKTALESNLGDQHDTVVIHPDFKLESDLVFNSDRFWLYTALNGAARLLVRDGLVVERSASVSSGLISTPWTIASTAATPAPQRLTQPLSSSTPGPVALQNTSEPGDLDFSIDSPVVSSTADRITFTIQRTGYLADISRLDFKLPGYTADLVPAAYGQVVFAPGETHRTLEIPLIQRDQKGSADQLPLTEIAVELTLRPADAAGPRRTSSYALNGLSGSSETIPDQILTLPSDLSHPSTLFARGAGLVLDTALSSRETADSSVDPTRKGWIALGLGSLQGPGANDVYLRSRDGRYLSIYDPALKGDLALEGDAIDDINTSSLFVSVRDNGLLDLDNSTNGRVDVSALPVLTSPGPVLLNNTVLRAPTRGDSQLWLDLSGKAAGVARLLLVPVADADGNLPAGWSDLQAYVASKPTGLQSLELRSTSLSQALPLLPDTDYRVVLQMENGTLRQPAISTSDTLVERSHSRYQLSAEGVALTLQLSSNRWVMPGLAGQEPLLVASLVPPAAAAAPAAPVELALVRVDGPSAGFDLDNSGSIDLRPDQDGYLAQLARRMGERDGMVTLSAQQDRVPLTFHAGDAVVPVLFEGISVADWLALPAEQRGLSGQRQDQPWRVAIDGQLAGATAADGRRLVRNGLNSWMLPGTGATLQISENLRTSPSAAFALTPTRRWFSGFDRDQVADLGFSEQRISDVQLVYKLTAAALHRPTAPDGGRTPISAVFDTASLAGSLDLGDNALAPTLLELNDGAPGSFNYNPLSRTGARWYSLHGQRYDTVAVSGRAGLAAGAEPNDRVTMALATYAPLLRSSAAGTGALQLQHSDGQGQSQGAPYNVDLQFTLTPPAGSGMDALKGVAYYLLPSSELDAAAAPSRDTVLRQGLKLFHTAPQWDQYLKTDLGISTTVQLPVGTDMRLVSLADGAAQAQLLPFAQGQGLLQASTSNGPTIAATIAATRADLSDFIARDQILSPNVNLQGLDRTTGLSIELSREASHHSSFGLYRAVDIAGGVFDPLTGNTVLYPGDPGYQAAALSPLNTANLPANLSVADRSTNRTRFDLDPTTAAVLFPYAITEGQTYLAFAEANPDGLQHFQTMGKNLIGFEDLPGLAADRDMDDVLIRIQPIAS
jgi:hypothetical protein